MASFLERLTATFVFFSIIALGGGLVTAWLNDSPSAGFFSEWNIGYVFAAIFGALAGIALFLRILVYIWTDS